MSGEKPVLLLHSCCAPCTVYVARKLSETYSVHLFFYNPNIYPNEEYEKRLREVERLAKADGLPLFVGPNDTENWQRITAGLEDSPEGGARCRKCYAMRLERVAEAAFEGGYDAFATTLTVSPHKRADVIHPLGKGLARKWDLSFHAEDFKKKDGFRKSCELSREFGFYRQDYCGCKFSLEGREQKKKPNGTKMS
jgi:predicted adenine nucleotide alpha hydrolase (AANH) superfamily ATPase